MSYTIEKLRQRMNLSFLILLCITFIDFMGMGLIYPIFSLLLFDSSSSLLPAATSAEMRGFWLGLLYALMPFLQLFSAPVWGALSDKLGRKKPLWISLSITASGHLVSLGGVLWGNLILLLLSRVILGIGCGNLSVVQASIADLSAPEEKTKNFGLFSMAIGAAFTLGPFFGGFFSRWGYSFPFLFSFFIAAMNLWLVHQYFRETLHTRSPTPLSWSTGLKNLHKAIHSGPIRTVLFCSFFSAFGWSFFMDFFPVYLMERFQFSAEHIGVFYGLVGGFYALSSGLLIRPVLKRLKSEALLFVGCVFIAPCLFSIPFFPSSLWLLPFIMVFTFLDALVYPTSAAIVSCHASADIQGEALGVLASVNTSAYAIAALSAGALIGLSAALSMWVGGSSFLIASLIVLARYRGALFTKKSL